MKVKFKWKKIPNVIQIKSEVLTPALMKFAHAELARVCKPYTPMDSGSLYKHTIATPKDLTYKSPYAWFLYSGKLMVGETSGKAYANKGEHKKVVEGVELKFSTAVNPMATKEWDKVAMRNGGIKLLGEGVVRYINKNK